MIHELQPFAGSCPLFLSLVRERVCSHSASIPCFLVGQGFSPLILSYFTTITTYIVSPSLFFSSIVTPSCSLFLFISSYKKLPDSILSGLYHCTVCISSRSSSPYVIALFIFAGLNLLEHDGWKSRCCTCFNSVPGLVVSRG